MKMGVLEKLFVNSAGHSQSVGRRAEQLVRLANPQAGQRYLDVGTGNGAAPIYLARRYGLEATGVDVDPDQIALAEQASLGLPNVHFFTQDGTLLPFGDAQFDIASAFRVAHHIPNWQAALSEMVRVLKPAGHFVFADLLVPDCAREFVARYGPPSAVINLPSSGRAMFFPKSEGMRKHVDPEKGKRLVYEP